MHSSELISIVANSVTWSHYEKPSVSPDGHWLAVPVGGCPDTPADFVNTYEDFFGFRLKVFDLGSGQEIQLGLQGIPAFNHSWSTDNDLAFLAIHNGTIRLYMVEMTTK